MAAIINKSEDQVIDALTQATAAASLQGSSRLFFPNESNTDPLFLVNLPFIRLLFPSVHN